MKRISNNLPVILAVLSLMTACQKENVVPESSFGADAPQEVQVILDVVPPETASVTQAPSSVATKIVHGLDPEDDTKHVIQWKAGDKFSLLGYVTSQGEHRHKLHNFSENRFTLTGETGSTQFSGYFPDFREIYPTANASARQIIYLWGIYPAATVSLVSENVPATATKTFQPETPLAISPVQDGTGWPYCVFFSRTGQNDSYYFNPNAGNGIRFSLGNCVLRLRVKSTKDITRMELTKGSGGNPYLVGDVTELTGTSVSMYISRGCLTTTLTVEGEGTLVTANQADYKDIYLAVRSLQSGVPYFFTFTAADGTSCTRQLLPSAAYGNGVHSLGRMTLSSWVTPEPAAAAALNMGMGINVGGLDCVTATTESIPERADSEGMHILDRSDPVTYETNGAKDRITQTTMNALKAAGFNTVRIPVTWFNHMGAPLSDDGQIDQVWLDHIASVVDLARSSGMYVIVNLHHDSGSGSHCWLKSDWTNYATISARLKSIWTQIATRFKAYDCHLLFEGYNEITDETGQWFTPSGTDGYKAANALNQDFVDAVRATGGNNAVRNLICSTYSASDRTEAMQKFVMPADILPGHLMVQVHSYLPIPFVTAREVGNDSRMEFYEEDKAEIDAMFERVQANILNKGWVCVMGEYGAFCKKSPSGNRNELGRAEHAYYYTTRALQRRIVPLYWYNPMDYRDRDTGNWTFPVMAQGLMDAWTDYQAGTVVYKKYNHDAAYPIQ